MESLKGKNIAGAVVPLSTALAFTLAFAPTVALAADGNIDLFSTDQAQLIDTTVADGGLSSSVGDGSDTTMLGGARDMFVDLLARDAANPNGNARIGVGAGAMSFSTTSLTNGTGTVQWDGPDGDIALNPTGLGGVDITAGGTATEFIVETLFSDLGFEFVITAWTDASHWTSISFSSTGVMVPTTSTIPFAAFMNPGACGIPNPAPGVNLITCSDGAGLPGGIQVADLTALGALELQIDPHGGTTAVDLTIDSITTEPEELLACRVTGGGVDTDLNWDGTLEDGDMRRGNGANNLPEEIDRYQFGGQAGANTGQQPQPKGEWTHHQQRGPSGMWTFHAGTASAPEGTEIDKITCTDPGFCNQARHAPNKQIDFEGVGTFKNVGKGKNAPIWGLDDMNMAPEPAIAANVTTGHGNKAYNGSYHWFEVNIDDLGEPRVLDTTPIAECPAMGWGVNGDPAQPADCGCPDFYRIKIYAGVMANPDGTPPEEGVLKGQELIYEAYGYIDGGNLQIHPPTGFDMK